MKKTSLFRLLAVLLAVTLVAAACGSDDPDPGDAGGSGAETDTTEPEDGDGTTAAPDTTADPGDTEPEDVVVSQGDGSLLDAIIERGSLNCGVSTVSIAFAVLDPTGRYVGFDADMCRAVAAAILGDSEAVTLVPLTASERFTAVQTGDVDLLMRNTTWTQSRDSDVGMDFGPTTYYDGQQLMGRVSDNFTNASGVADIDGAVICTNAGTTTEKNISDAADAAGVSITLQTFEDFDIVTDNFINRSCDIITTDGSGLVGRKAEQQPADQEWVIFPATPISKEPLGPTYGQNDSKFADAVNWTMYAMVIADEKGINAGNAESVVGNDEFDAEAQRLMGGEGEVQSAMGLSADAFQNVIVQVGNYDEVFVRHLEPVGIFREGSANAGWEDGGLIYAPPAR